jgi:ketosteroid isomerase-like protein
LPADDTLRQEILGFEKKRAEAMIRQDIDTLAALLAEDLSYTHSDGRTDTRDSFLRLIASGEIRYLDVEYSDQDVIDCGGAVLVRGTAALRLLKAAGGRQDYRVLFLDVWARRPTGGWQMVAWQATRA